MGSRTHSVLAGFALLRRAGLGIVVLFDDDVHVHICHHLARVGRGTVGRRGAGRGHLGGM